MCDMLQTGSARVHNHLLLFDPQGYSKWSVQYGDQAQFLLILIVQVTYVVRIAEMDYLIILYIFISGQFIIVLFAIYAVWGTDLALITFTA